MKNKIEPYILPDGEKTYTAIPEGEQPNQLYPELMSTLSLQPFDGAISSGRKYMFAGHLGQTLPIKNPTERKIQTGMENEYGKYTNNIKMPENGTVVKVLQMYPQLNSEPRYAYSPLTLMVYESEDGILGCVEITRFYFNYHHYGFPYKAQPAMARLREGSTIAKDTVFMDSFSKTQEGAYAYGREVKVAFMSDPGVAEDGIRISSDVLDHFSFRTYEKRSVSWGSNKFPINLYGDEHNYKPFPDIGELLHPKDQHRGLLMALREYDEDMAVIDQNITAVNYPDSKFDEMIFANGAYGRVVDLRVYHNNQAVQRIVDPAMSVQPKEYDNARRHFYKELVSLYNKIRQERGKNARFTPELHRWIVEAIALVGDEYVEKYNYTNKSKVDQIYRKKLIDEWRIDFTIEYILTPDIGAKMTDTHGGRFINQ